METMQPKASTNTRPYAIHLLYAGSFLLAVLSVIAYLVWDKHEIASEKARQFELQRQAELNRKLRVITCVASVQTNYKANWTNACITNARNIKSELANCFENSKKSAAFITANGKLGGFDNLYQSYVAQCKSMYGTPNSEPNCLLPNNMANRIEEWKNNGEKQCELLA